MSRRARLREALARYAPLDAAEAAHKQRMHSWIARAADPFDRHQYAPGHVTASAFVLSAEADSVLLVLHAKLGRWLQPGGHVDPTDDDVMSAARREVAEETGVRELESMHDGIFDLDIHTIPAHADAPEHTHFDVRFAFRAVHGWATAASDALDVRWVPLHELPRMRTDASVVRAAAKLRGHGSLRRR